MLQHLVEDTTASNEIITNSSARIIYSSGLFKGHHYFKNKSNIGNLNICVKK
jgi:hypothetical protein